MGRAYTLKRSSEIGATKYAQSEFSEGCPRRDVRYKQPLDGNRKTTADFLSRRLRVAPRKSKLRYSAIDDQFRSGHEGGILAREEQRCLGDFPGLAETMQWDLILDCRGGFVELFLGKSELAVKRRAGRAGTHRVHTNAPRCKFRTQRAHQRTNGCFRGR